MNNEREEERKEREVERKKRKKKEKKKKKKRTHRKTRGIQVVGIEACINRPHFSIPLDKPIL